VVAERGHEAQCLQKLLEDAGIKLDSVATDIQGVSCRRMMEAPHSRRARPRGAGRHGPHAHAPQIADPREALVGRFDSHHALLVRMHLDHMDQLTRTEQRLDQEVDRLMAPFR
jgi:transposase